MQHQQPLPSASERDEHYMRLALAAAERGAREGEVPVGAVLVSPEGREGGGVVLACSHNAPIGLHDPTAHAEIRVLREAALQMGNYRLDGCDLYVTLEPCAMCAQAMLHARVKRVVYGAAEPKTGAAGSVLNLFAVPELNHQTEVVAGVLAQECAGLMRTFFEGRRRNAKLHAEPLREDALRTPAQAFDAAWERWPMLRSASRTLDDIPHFEGLRFHYLDVGDAHQGEAWLALHGPDGWWPQWAEWALARAQLGERVLVPDLMGFGQSDKPKKSNWHSLQVHVQGLLGWLQRLGVKRLRLAVAPGQEFLANAFVLAWGVGAADIDLHASRQAKALPDAWQNLPYPDAGHRAAQRAWRTPGGPGGGAGQ
jgi:tRNA(adenine34) deaminase